MAGLDKNTAVPTEIKLRQISRVMEITFSDGKCFSLPYEYLRVYSPSAEVRGHGVGQKTLQAGKQDIEISVLEPVGAYAVRPVFSDGHDSGLYSWDYLYELGMNYADMWQRYLQKLAAAGASREIVRSPAPQSRGKCDS